MPCAPETGPDSFNSRHLQRPVSGMATTKKRTKVPKPSRGRVRPNLSLLGQSEIDEPPSVCGRFHYRALPALVSHTRLVRESGRQRFPCALDG